MIAKIDFQIFSTDYDYTTQLSYLLFCIHPFSECAHDPVISCPFMGINEAFTYAK